MRIGYYRIHHCCDSVYILPLCFSDDVLSCSVIYYNWLSYLHDTIDQEGLAWCPDSRQLSDLPISNFPLYLIPLSLVPSIQQTASLRTPLLNSPPAPRCSLLSPQCDLRQSRANQASAFLPHFCSLVLFVFVVVLLLSSSYFLISISYCCTARCMGLACILGLELPVTVW